MCFSHVMVACWWFPVVFVIPTPLPAVVFPFLHPRRQSQHRSCWGEIQQCLVEQKCVHAGCSKSINKKRMQQRGSFSNVLIQGLKKCNFSFQIFFSKMKKKAFCCSWSLLIIHISDHLLLYSWSDFVHVLNFTLLCIHFLSIIYLLWFY